MPHLFPSALSCLLCLLVVWAVPALAEPVTITAAGSGVNLAITRQLAEAFTAGNPNIKIDVPGSIGTRGAIKAVADNAISLGLVSRPLIEEEKALGIVAQPYARTAIVLAAHAGVKDRNVTTQALIDIIKGVKTTWEDGNQIVVQVREKSDSGFLVFENTLPGFKEAYAESHTAKRWIVYYNDQDANQALATIPYSIGVTDLGMIVTEKLKVKALLVNGIDPTLENVQNGTYPLSRQLSFIYKAEALSPEAKAFIDWVASEAGEDLLHANGYLPVQ